MKPPFHVIAKWNLLTKAEQQENQHKPAIKHERNLNHSEEFLQVDI